MMNRPTIAAVLALAATGCPKRDPTPDPTRHGRDTSTATGAAASARSRSASPRPAAPSSAVAAAFSERVAERRAFVRATIEARGVLDPSVLAAMRKVPRHRFVLPESESQAYSDRPLRIPGGQTISQPYIVAAMTEAAAPNQDSRCLEIGTGSGYQAAVLAELCKQVFSIEYLPEVAAFGAQNLRSVGYQSDRVRLRVGDGYRGWPEAAPFDAILVTAAPETVPKPLLEQLALGGRLVIPVGPSASVQTLERWTRTKSGEGNQAFHREELMGVRFVPFLGEGKASQ